MTDTIIKLNLSEQDGNTLPGLAELGVISWDAAARACLYKMGWTQKQVDAFFAGTAKSPRREPQPTAVLNGKNGHKAPKGMQAPKRRYTGNAHIPENFAALWNDHSTTLATVSASLGVPVSTMRRWAIDRGLPARPRGRRPRPLPTPKAV